MTSHDIFVAVSPETYINPFPLKGLTCSELSKDTCNSGACIEKDKVCDNSNDCFDLSDEIASVCFLYKYRCTFEGGLCSDWEQDIDSTASWVVHKASPDYSGSLPALDHTTSTINGWHVSFCLDESSVWYYFVRCHVR